MFRKRRRTSFDPRQPEMIHIPPGPFIMGTDSAEVRRLTRSARSDRDVEYTYEQPVHEVVLPEFYVGRYPVTVSEFEAFIEAGGYEEQAFWSEGGWRWRTQNRITKPVYWDGQCRDGRDNYPVVGISWFTAGAYCVWLRVETGLSYRLPTEPEWEKAARGPEGLSYPWGERWQAKRCNVAKQEIISWDARRDPVRRGQLAPVGQFSPDGDSPYGCVDMVGNTWEWCLTPLRNYPLPQGRPSKPPGNFERLVVRGGSWYHGPEDARCAARYGYYPQGRDNVVGFRLAF